MRVIFSGRYSHDPERQRVCYEISIDGELVLCEIADASLSRFFEDQGEPLATFRAATLAILEYTKLAYQGELLPFDLDILARKQAIPELARRLDQRRAEGKKPSGAEAIA